MQIGWNRKIAFIVYLVIGSLLAVAYRLAQSPSSTNEPIPIGKTIHLMPVDP